MKEDNMRFDNNISMIASGYRNNQPVALVERNINDDIEYIIAFNYMISDNKINWGYGYYYDTDIEKARNDFNKVLAGGNLADTFSNKNKEQER